MARSSLLTVLLLSTNTLLVLAQGGLPSAKFRHRELESKGPSAGVIPGLLGNLQARQSCTTSGYTLCPSGIVCCPTGGQCCPDNTCCPSGYNCFNLNGREGCCPIGQTCTSISGCVTPGYVPCPNDSFCCPPGQTCSRVGGIPMCNAAVTTTTPAPPPPPPVTTTVAPPPPVTTTAAPPPPVTVTPPTSQTQTSLPDLNPPSTKSVSSSSPGPTNATISPSSPIITYNGNWQPSSALCNPGGQSKTCQGAGNSLSFKFQGTAVYVIIGESPNGGRYSTTIDGQTTESDSFSTSGATDCKMGFSQAGLTDKEHTVVLKSLGSSSLAPSGSSGNVDFEGLILTQDTSSSPSTQNSMALPSFVTTRINILTLTAGFVIWLVL